MTPAFTFLFGLALLILFGWYFATDYGARKRLLATILMVLLVVFSLVTIYPPDKKIQLGTRHPGRHIVPDPSRWRRQRNQPKRCSTRRSR